MAQDLSKLWALLEPVINGMGFELIDIEHVANPKHGVLRLYIDNDAGVNIDDCSVVSHQISALLDVEEPIRGHFNLEISSPGLDRPLNRLKDYQRFEGEIVKIKTSMPMDGQRNFKGRLLTADAQTVVIETETEEISLPMAAIDKTRLVPQF